jgi:hypothetical protein
LWGDERLRRITLEELCRSWNLNRLLQEGELSFRMRMRSTPVFSYGQGNPNKVPLGRENSKKACAGGQNPCKSRLFSNFLFQSLYFQSFNF